MEVLLEYGHSNNPWIPCKHANALLPSKNFLSLLNIVCTERDFQSPMFKIFKKNHFKTLCYKNIGFLVNFSL